MTRARAAAYWMLPALICLAVHWRGFESWFRGDDFAWLSLYSHIHSFGDLLSALFRPQAQGTIRPWSERAFFILGYGLFGLNALPFRIVIFATQFLALALAQAIGWKLTASRAAGFCAAVLWIANSSSMEPLSWVCVYNEVMCAAFLMGALWMRIRYLETGQRRFHIWEWVIFVLGFGALELNIVYPALALAYTWLRARKLWRGTLPMFAVSLVYFALHSWAAPAAKTGAYALRFGPSILRTLATYWTWSIGPVYLATPPHLKRWMLVAAIGLVTLGLATFAIRKLRAGITVPLFCLAWYLIAFAPTLPLRDHMTEYYPYIPVIGLAWLGGWALAEAWQRPGASRSAAILLGLLYLGLVLPRTIRASNWNYHLAEKAHNLVTGVARATMLHPGEAILLDGADEEQYLSAIRDKAFVLVGANHVYLAPGSEKNLTQQADWGSVSDNILAPSVVATALDRGQLEVYDVRNSTLRNITSTYAANLRTSGLPLRVSVSDALTNYLLGPEWYPLDIDHRWMPQRATLRMGAPQEPGRKLYLQGYCAEGLGAAEVTVNIDGQPLPPQPVHPGKFELAFPLPDSLTGKREMRVAVELSKTFRPPNDPRDLGLSFGVFEVR